MLSAQIKKFISVIDHDFIEPKKEEYYSLLKDFKKCKEIIKNIGYRRKVKRKSLIEWVWTWILYIKRNPRSAFYVLFNTRRDLKLFLEDYWNMKSILMKIERCIDELDTVAENFERFMLEMEGFDERFKKFKQKMKEIDAQET